MGERLEFYQYFAFHQHIYGGYLSCIVLCLKSIGISGT